MEHGRDVLAVITVNDAAPSGRTGESAQARGTPSLFARLERAHAQLSELIEGFDGLPEAYVSGSRSWTSYGEIEKACELISSAHSDLIGG